MSNPSEPNGVIWVTSEVSPDGAYLCVIHYTEDLVHAVNQEEAVAYGLAMSGAAAAAEYDAAVSKQIREKLELPVEAAGDVLVRLRKKRGGTTWKAGPLEVDAGVSAFTGKPFLRCQAGALNWQWDPKDMRDHVFNVLEVAGGVTFDQDYRGVLVDQFGLDDDRASAVVADLIHFRDR